MLNIAVLGAGHWGPNLIRNFDNHLRSRVLWVVDLNADRLNNVKKRFPQIQTSSDPKDALTDDKVDAVVVATPTVTHYELVKQAIEHDKHVMVEKPLTTDPEQGQELVELAESRGRVLLVGHVFIYNPAVQWVKRYIDSGEAGQIYYFSSLRTNLGPVRMDVNAAWDLAAQDLSIFDYWLDAGATSVSAVGGNWINPGIQDAVFGTLRYPGDVLAHFHVSWLNPRKVRDITVVAENRMLTYDDMNLNEPIRVYDKGVTEKRAPVNFVDSFALFRSSIRDGDITIPHVPMGEPLRNECEHFLDCLESGKTPMTGGPEAMRVVRTLNAIARSMDEGGNEVTVE